MLLNTPHFFSFLHLNALLWGEMSPFIPEWINKHKDTWSTALLLSHKILEIMSMSFSFYFHHSPYTAQHGELLFHCSPSLFLYFYKFFVSITRHTTCFDHICLPCTNSSKIHLIFFPIQLCVYVFNPSGQSSTIQILLDTWPSPEAWLTYQPLHTLLEKNLFLPLPPVNNCQLLRG